MPERVGDQATMEPPKFERCSILLTFQKLMISDSNRTIELWTKQPRRDGGTRVGAIWGSAEGRPCNVSAASGSHPVGTRCPLLLTFPTCPQASFHTAWVGPGGQSVGPACAILLRQFCLLLVVFLSGADLWLHGVKRSWVISGTAWVWVGGRGGGWRAAPWAGRGACDRRSPGLRSVPVRIRRVGRPVRIRSDDRPIQSDPMIVRSDVTSIRRNVRAMLFN